MATEDRERAIQGRLEEVVRVLGGGEIIENSKPAPASDAILGLLECVSVLAKYTQLDLEATRRERDRLQKLVDQNEGEDK